MQKLPNAEFEVMKVVWGNEAPITSSIVMQQLGREKLWKAPTINALMMRLVERGFLHTEKKSKERLFYPLVVKEEYLEFETKNFIERYHENSFVSLFNTLYGGKNLSPNDINELLNDLKKHTNKKE